MVDDREVSGELRLGRMVGEIRAPAKGGLYVAGVPSLAHFGVQKADMVKTLKGFHGNVRDIVFMDDE